MDQSNHSVDAKEYFDHNTAQPGPDNLFLGLFFFFFLMEFFSNKVPETRSLRTPKETLGRGRYSAQLWKLGTGCGISDPGLGPL